VRRETETGERPRSKPAHNDLFERLRGEKAFAGVADLLAIDSNAKNFRGSGCSAARLR